MSSSSNQFPAFYGQQQQQQQQATSNSLGMGSLQNMSSRSPLSQLAAARSGMAVGGGSSGAGGSNNGAAAVLSSSGSSSVFNTTVGGDRLTPAAAPSGGGGSSGFPNPISQPNRQSTMGMNLLQSSSSSSNRPLFNRDRKMDSGLNAFDPSEFPSLGNRDNSAPNPSLSARPNYVGMVKQPAMESSEFTMSNEDFPALPGCKPQSSHEMAAAAHAASQHAAAAAAAEVAAVAAGGSGNGGTGSGGGGGPPSGGGGPPGMMGGGNNASSLGGVGAGNNGVNTTALQAAKLNTSQQGLFSEASLSGGVSSGGIDHQSTQLQQPRGILTSPDGMVTNIPASMVRDQFGMIGLLTFIRAAETDPNLVSLALGADLTTLGLNLNSEVNLYPTFAGPWADTPCRPQDIDYHVPNEYLTNTSIRDKLAPVKLNRYKDDVLFYMFYTNVGDVLQLAAAAELYSRDWRFHKDDKVWITRAPGMAPSEKTASYERGTYYFFDVTNWRKVPKEFHLDYDKLEDRPSLPTNLTGGGASGGNGNGQNSSATTGGSGSTVPSSATAMPSTNGPNSQAASAAGSGMPPTAPVGGGQFTPNPHLPLPSVLESRGVPGGGGNSGPSLAQ